MCKHRRVFSFTIPWSKLSNDIISLVRNTTHKSANATFEVWFSVLVIERWLLSAYNASVHALIRPPYDTEYCRFQTVIVVLFDAKQLHGDHTAQSAQFNINLSTRKTEKSKTVEKNWDIIFQDVTILQFWKSDSANLPCILISEIVCGLKINNAKFDTVEINVDQPTRNSLPVLYKQRCKCNNLERWVMNFISQQKITAVFIYGKCWCARHNSHVNHTSDDMATINVWFF